MKRWLAVSLGVLAVLVGVLLLRTARLPSHQLAVEAAPPIPLDADSLAARLARGLRFRTISHEDRSLFPADEFARFRSYLREAYPGVHTVLERELVNGHSLLYTWRGQDPDLAPVVLLAHQDVVPVEPGTQDRWGEAPFGGAVSGGFVWGRGAIDDKAALFALLEACEWLLERGWQPERTVMLAFSHDEEVGQTGAAATAELLAEQGIEPLLVLDEGLAVIDGMLPGVDRPLALVGVAEKGYATVTLSVESEGGHSSTPPPQTAVGVVAAAVTSVEQSPMPARIRGPLRSLFTYLAPELPFAVRIPFANLWLFEPVLVHVMAGDRAMNANLRTTTAATMIEGGVKANVLPGAARASINFRILPGDTTDDVMEHVRRAVDDPRVEIAFAGSPRNPSAVSPVDGPGFQLVERTIAEVFPGAIVAPGLVVGGTDSRNYAIVSDTILRFNPFVFQPGDLGRVHGTDERISVAHYARGVRWFIQLIQNTSSP